MGVSPKILVQLLKKLLWGSLSNHTSFIQKFQDPGILLDQIDNRLVVKVVDWGPLNTFPLVLLLFLFQHQIDEDLLQLFIAIVDAKLLERVHHENFEPVDIQDSNHNFRSPIALQRTVDVVHHPVKEFGVQSLAHRLTLSHCVLFVQGDDGHLRTRVVHAIKGGYLALGLDIPCDQSLLQLAFVHGEHLGCCIKRVSAIAADRGSVLM